MGWVFRIWPGAWRSSGSATVQALAFSGFGDDPIVFLDYDGNTLTPPASNPTCGPGCDGFVKLVGPGLGWGVVGGNAPTFPTTGTGIFGLDFLTSVDSAAGPDGFGGNSGGRDGLGNFYSSGFIAGRVYRTNSSGVQTASWLVGGNPQTGAPNVAGTVYYYVDAGSLNTIRAWDLVGDVSLGVFVTEAGYTCNQQNILTLSNGDVIVGWNGNGATVGRCRRYTSAGLLAQTYILAGAGTDLDPIWMSNGESDAEFWVGYYNNALATFSGVTVANLVTATGIVLHTFDPEIGTFQFDGAAAQGPLGSASVTAGTWTQAFRG